MSGCAPTTLCFTKQEGFAEACAAAIAPKRTKPYRPKTNVKVERLQQTMDREWARAHLPLE